MKDKLVKTLSGRTTLYLFLFIFAYGRIVLFLLPDEAGYTFYTYVGIVPPLVLIVVYYFDFSNLREKIRFPTVKESGFALIAYVGLQIIDKVYYSTADYLGLPIAGSSVELAGDPIIEVVLWVMVIALYTPFIEEYTWRELMQKRMLGDNLNKWGAIILAALLWSILHVQRYGINLGGGVVIGNIFIAGIIYGILYERTDNLFLPILIHVMNNLTAAFIIIIYEFGFY